MLTTIAATVSSAFAAIIVGALMCSGDAQEETVDAVVVEDLRKSYGATRAVAGVSFTVKYGEIFSLLGPNGAGKTTVLEILEGYRQADEGKVVVAGFDPGDRRTGRQLREQIGLVLQELAVEPYLTVRESVSRNAGYYPDPRDVGEVIGCRPHRQGEEQGQVAVRRQEAAAGSRPRHHREPQGPVPRRADDRLRPERATRRLGGHQGAFRPGHHDLAHHPLHGRGAGARRPGCRHLRRQDHRRGERPPRSAGVARARISFALPGGHSAAQHLGACLERP